MRRSASGSSRPTPAIQRIRRIGPLQPKPAVRLTTYVTSSDRGRYSVLKRNHLESLLDFDKARARTAALGAGGGPLAARAQTLVAAFNSADPD